MRGAEPPVRRGVNPHKAGRPRGVTRGRPSHHLPHAGPPALRGASPPTRRGVARPRPPRPSHHLPLAGPRSKSGVSSRQLGPPRLPPKAGRPAGRHPLQAPASLGAGPPALASVPALRGPLPAPPKAARPSTGCRPWSLVRGPGPASKGGPPSKRPALPGPLMGRCKTNKSSQGRADAQRLVATRLLDRVHDPLGHFSRLQRIYPRAR
ncbi:hypothetical protein N7466_006670 [Penicillium verhagenii]|nr:hypothetical protein N7466_006670 [Penicillium verhagenii]